MPVDAASASGEGVAPPLGTDASQALARWEARGRRRARRLVGTALIVGAALAASLVFANETSAGKFLDRLPHLFDFATDLVPRDAVEPLRALLDLPSPYDDGSLKHDYPEGRVPLAELLGDGPWASGEAYVPEYVHLLLVTLNVALLSTLVGAAAGLLASFVAASNLVTDRWLRGSVRRVLEVLRAFPEIVIAGFFVAILALGPIPAIIAITLHTTGALGKLFYEIVENVDPRPSEGLEAVGARWGERVRYGVLPEILPNVASYTLLRFEINVRASTIIGAVGGGGIGEALRLSISRGHEAKTLAIIALLFLTIVAVDALSARLRTRFLGARRERTATASAAPRSGASARFPAEPSAGSSAGRSAGPSIGSPTKSSAELPTKSPAESPVGGARS